MIRKFKFALNIVVCLFFLLGSTLALANPSCCMKPMASKEKEVPCGMHEGMTIKVSENKVGDNGVEKNNNSADYCKCPDMCNAPLVSETKTNNHFP